MVSNVRIVLCCRSHVVYFSPWHKFVYFNWGISYYFAFLHQRSSPFTCKMLLFFFFCLCGCCYGERGRLCFSIRFVGPRAFACVSAVFVHLLGFACWISLQREKISYWMLLIWEHKSSYASKVSGVCERERACVDLFACVCVYNTPMKCGLMVNTVSGGPNLLSLYGNKSRPNSPFRWRWVLFSCQALRRSARRTWNRSLKHLSSDTGRHFNGLLLGELHVTKEHHCETKGLTRGSGFHGEK